MAIYARRGALGNTKEKKGILKKGITYALTLALGVTIGITARAFISGNAQTPPTAPSISSDVSNDSSSNSIYSSDSSSDNDYSFEDSSYDSSSDSSFDSSDSSFDSSDSSFDSSSDSSSDSSDGNTQEEDAPVDSGSSSDSSIEDEDTIEIFQMQLQKEKIMDILFDDPYSYEFVREDTIEVEEAFLNDSNGTSLIVRYTNTNDKKVLIKMYFEEVEQESDLTIKDGEGKIYTAILEESGIKKETFMQYSISEEGENLYFRKSTKEGFTTTTFVNEKGEVKDTIVEHTRGRA